MCCTVRVKNNMIGKSMGFAVLFFYEVILFETVSDPLPFRYKRTALRKSA